MAEPVEAVIFSDAHVHSFRYKSSKVPLKYGTGIFNSRLADTITAMYEMAQYVIDNSIKIVMFCGDMFHTRKAIYNDEINLVYECLKFLARNGVEIIMIPGNHDYGDREGNWNSIQPFDAIEGVTVASNDVGVHARVGGSLGLNIVTVPYTDNPKIAKERLVRAASMAEYYKEDGLPLVLMAHLGMQGAKVGSDYVLVSDGDISVDDVPYKDFTACFFGHFHEHQKLFPNGWFVGALTQHNWSDSGGKRGFLHAKFWRDKVEFERIETNAPKFVDITEGEKYDAPRPHDFVRYNTTQLLTNELIRSLKEELGVTHFDPRMIYSDEEEAELSVDKLNPTAMLPEWVKLKGKEDDTELLRLGEEILAEASEKTL